MTALLAVSLTCLLAISACTTEEAGRSRETVKGAENTGTTRENLKGMVYRTVDGEDLMVDACLASASESPTPAILLIHGGGFAEGGRASGGMPRTCDLLAQAGYSAFSIDYRLLPDSSYPAQITDAEAAVAWLREPQQVKRFGIDPDRIGVLGSSAGAIIAQGLGTSGAGALTSGSRVRAVVSLSGASDFTSTALAFGDPGDEVQQLVLAYLGCPSLDACAVARDASPLYAVTADDSPMILVHSRNEIVPVGQAQTMHAALTAAGVDAKLTISEGNKHGVSLLNSRTMQTIFRFLLDYL
ncbi:MAG: alpha/beta hydrolase [Rhodoglobus sp.]